jgi:hypothetical protein
VVLGHDVPARGGDRAHWSSARRWPKASTRCSPKPVLHGDNGSTLKATTMLAMLHWLGVKPS